MFSNLLKFAFLILLTIWVYIQLIFLRLIILIFFIISLVYLNWIFSFFNWWISLRICFFLFYLTFFLKSSILRRATSLKRVFIAFCNFIRSCFIENTISFSILKQYFFNHMIANMSWLLGNINFSFKSLFSIFVRTIYMWNSTLFQNNFNLWTILPNWWRICLIWKYFHSSISRIRFEIACKIPFF